LPPSQTSSLPSLAGADWLKWPGTEEIFSAISARGHQVRAVGGAVRDALLGRAVRDVDFSTTALPETVMELALEAGLKAIPTGLDHGTVTVVAEDHAFEVTTLRKDVETFGRRAKIAYTDDWAADAGRRDFTINALYVDADGTLHDPLGGHGDIEKRNIRFIGDARERVREDYLRILRFFRFHAELEKEEFDARGLKACVLEQAGLNLLSAERVRSELLRLLRADGAIKALWKMFDHGLLVQILGGVPYFSSLDRMIAIEKELGMDPDEALRLASLAVEVVEDAERLTDRLRLSKMEKLHLVQASDYREVSSGMDDMDIRRELFSRGPVGCRNTALMSWAKSGDAVSDAGWQRLVAATSEISVPVFPLKGSDIVQLGVPQGAEVGRILKKIEERWQTDGFTAGKTELLEIANELVKSSVGKA
jgi:poly(A) polymerase